MMSETFQVRSGSYTHPGRKRRNNEDFAAFFEPADPLELNHSGRLYIVADGVGGASYGENASRYAAEKVLFEYYQYPELDPRERLKNAIRQASEEIYLYAEMNDFRMATTMVATVVIHDNLVIANVGDSRAYILRSGRAQQLTEDHTEVAEMVRNGLLTADEAKSVKGKNRISRSLGGERDVRVDVFGPIKLKQGDRILLCSDGLTRYAGGRTIVELVADVEPEEGVERLIDFANQQGGADNISAILIEIGQEIGTEEPTIQMERGHYPKDVDLDTIDVEPPKTRRSKINWSEVLSKPSPKNIILMTAVFLAILTVIVGVVLLIIYVSHSNQEAAMDRADWIVSTNQTEISTVQSNEALDGTASLTTTQEIQSTSSVLPTLENGVTSAFTLTQTITPTILTGEVENLESLLPCEYTVVEGDNFSVITQIKLGIEVEPEFVKCVEDDLTCSFNPDNPDLIFPGWQLIFPDVDPVICQDNMGIPLTSD